MQKVGELSVWFKMSWFWANVSAILGWTGFPYFSPPKLREGKVSFSLQKKEALESKKVYLVVEQAPPCIHSFHIFSNLRCLVRPAILARACVPLPNNWAKLHATPAYLRNVKASGTSLWRMRPTCKPDQVGGILQHTCPVACPWPNHEQWIVINEPTGT